FGSMDDIMIAADLMVHAGDEGFESQVPRAIMAALPLVIAKTRTALEFIGETPETDLVHWFEPDQPQTLQAAVKGVLRDHDAARKNAESLRRQLLRRHPREEFNDRYATLFRKLVEAKSSPVTRRVAEASE
ncbi:MAG: hypothetical protein AAFX06_26300, partial [Planctomycetota bacterium]